MGEYDVVVASGSMRTDDGSAFTWPHRWTDGGVSVSSAFTGAHVLHLSVAACILNDLHREAHALGVALRGVRVTASGGFGDDWSSTGITYSVEVDADAPEDEVARLVALVDEVAEIPKAVRAGMRVARA